MTTAIEAVTSNNPFKDELVRLTRLRRSRNNLGLIQEALAELHEHAEAAQEYFRALANLREAIREFQDALGDDSGDNPLVPDASGELESVNEFAALLPGDEEDQDISELISEADDAATEYEDSLEDREYSAQDREELWDTLCNAVTSIAEMI